MTTKTAVQLHPDDVLVARELVRDEIMERLATIADGYAEVRLLQEALDLVTLIREIGEVESAVRDRHCNLDARTTRLLLETAEAQVRDGEDAALLNWDDETPRYEELVASARRRAENGRRVLAALNGGADYAEPGE